MKLSVATQKKQEIIDITDEIQNKLQAKRGAVIISALHTTCAVTCAELDPGTDEDFLDFLRGITPNIKWRHPHNPKHAPAHLLSSIIGPSVSIPVNDGQLMLGSWQRVVLVELDGPRTRNLEVTIVDSKS